MNTVLQPRKLYMTETPFDLLESPCMSSLWLKFHSQVRYFHVNLLSAVLVFPWAREGIGMCTAMRMTCKTPPSIICTALICPGRLQCQVKFLQLTQHEYFIAGIPGLENLTPQQLQAYMDAGIEFGTEIVGDWRFRQTRFCHWHFVLL